MTDGDGRTTLIDVSETCLDVDDVSVMVSVTCATLIQTGVTCPWIDSETCLSVSSMAERRPAGAREAVTDMSESG